MIAIKNNTNFQAGIYAGFNSNGQHQLTCVIKASLKFEWSGKLTLLEVADPIIEADQYNAAPTMSSLAAAHEIMPYKQGSEWLLFGTVVCDDALITQKDISVSFVRDAQSVKQKILRVFGQRSWYRKILRYHATPPAAIGSINLRYEFAYGGYSDLANYYHYNPAGCGYYEQALHAIHKVLPRIEKGPDYIRHPQQRVMPAGFGPIPSWWQPRLDKNIIKQNDAVSAFDKYNVAPLDQRCEKSFVGGEQLIIKGFQQDLTLEIPVIDILLNMRWKQGGHFLPNFYWDTWVIEVDKKKCHLTGRAAIPSGLPDFRQGTLTIEAKM